MTTLFAKRIEFFYLTGTIIHMKRSGIFILLLLAGTVHGQTNDAPTQGEIEKFHSSFLSTDQFILSTIIVCFGLLVILLEVFLVIKRKIPYDVLVKFIVITLIIFATLFLIAAGYTNNQIAPAAGLFGTIAGYLLGKSNQTKSDETKSEE